MGNNNSQKHRMEEERRRYAYSGNRINNHIIETRLVSSNIYPNLNRDLNADCRLSNQGFDSSNAFINGSNAFINKSSGTSSTIHTNSDNMVSQQHCIQHPTTNRSSVAPSAPPLESTYKAQSSTNRSINQLPKLKLDHITCDICKKKLGLVIYNCATGHSACEKCKLEQKPCNICQQPITDQRNRMLEDMVGQFPTPCPYKYEGCKLNLKLCDMKIHEKECPFNEIACPLILNNNQCSWKGDRTQVKRHLSYHDELSESEMNCEMVLRKKDFISPLKRIYHLQLETNSFLVHIKAFDGKFLATTQLLGSKAKAEEWSYTLNIYNKMEPRRKYTYTDTCHSSNVSECNIFQHFKCAYLPMLYLNTYFNRGDVLNFKLLINKKE